MLWKKLSYAASIVAFYGITQVISFASSIVALRIASKQDYALLTVAFSLQSSLSVLTDIGISTALWSIGGRIWRNDLELSKLLSTARYARRMMLLITCPLIIPLFILLFQLNGAALTVAIALTAATIGELWLRVDCDIVGVALRLKQRVRSVQATDLSASLIRFFLLLILAITKSTASLIALTSLIAAAGKLWHARCISPIEYFAPKPTERVFLDEIVKLAKPQLLNATYFCFQAQFTIWLLAFFGDASSVADLGALGRLAALAAISQYFINLLVVPRFAMSETRMDAGSIFGFVVGMVAVSTGVMILIAALAPQVILSVFGKAYMHLGTALVLMLLKIGLEQLSTSMWALNSSRGWVRHSWLYMPTTLFAQIVCLLYMDLSTVQSVLLFSCITQAPFVLLNLFIAKNGLRKMDNWTHRRIATEDS